MCCVVRCACGRLREEQRLRASEDSVLRKGCTSERNKEAGENCVVRSCIICTVRQVLLRSADRGWLGELWMWHLGGGGRKGFDREHVTERDFLEGLGVDKRGYIEMVVRK